MEETQQEKLWEEKDAWIRNLSSLGDKSQLLFNKLFEKKIPASAVFQMIHFNQVYQQFIKHLLAKPEKLLNAQINYWQELYFLWQHFMLNKQYDESKPEAKDFQFKDWQENPAFHFIKDFYQLHVRHFQALLQMTEGLDKKTSSQIQFYFKQVVEALSPTNFAVTNPEVWRTTLENRGENLLKGLDNALNDLSQDQEYFQIKMTDTSHYEIGKNVAITPGKVVYQNDLIQLIQYEPQTRKVYQRPILFVPPWINKYYIFDLTPSFSLVNWLVQQSYTVFMISWVNPDNSLSQKEFSDYLLEGPLQALKVIKQACGVNEINTLGYCVGGTLLACAMAYQAARGEGGIQSASYLCALLDFSEPGDIGAFIDDHQLQWLEKEMQNKGYLDGRQMATTFNILRPKDLIWSYYVKNYLLGESPAPHDLLFWNSDSTNIPEKMHRFYLRNMYLDNGLKKGSLSLNNQLIDLKMVQAPACFIGALQDHIAPWKSVYAGLKLYAGPAEFILSGSGHIAGAINPPERNKYQYYLNPQITEAAEAWLQFAKEHTGSWWPHWEKWLRRYSGDQVEARMPGDTGLALIEDAPGTYVRKRLSPR